MELVITKDVEIFLGLGITLTTAILGYIVYMQNRKSWTNRFFLILSFLIIGYVWVNYISLHPPGGPGQNQLFWVRNVMLVTSFIGPALFMLIHTFPGERIRLGHKWRIGLIGLMFASAYAAVTPLVFNAISYPNGEPVPIPGPGILIFMLDFIGLFLASFVVLIYRYQKARGTERRRLLHLLIGVTATFSIMGLSTVVFVVVLKTSAGVFLGPLSTAILLAAISYSIVRHQLFNIKIIATKILVALIASIFGIKLFLDDSATDRIIDGLMLLIVIFFGYLLVQSVRQEISRREQISRLAKSLEHANARLQEQDKIKTEFLSIASHQLRTPLSIIKGYSELISEGAFGKIGKKVKNVLANIDESNEHLIKLVDEFLNISRIEQGRTQYHFEKTSLRELLAGVVHELGQKANAKGIKLQVDASSGKAMALVDGEKLRHGMYNFIDNAIKYSPKKTTIHVSLKKEGKGYVYQVQDAGVGLDESDVRNMFQKFYRSPHVMRDFQGNGLGLYVVRQFVEAHGGKVWAKSKGVGKGSEFGFSVPLQPPKRLQVAAKRQKKAEAKRKPVE